MVMAYIWSFESWLLPIFLTPWGQSRLDFQPLKTILQKNERISVYFRTSGLSGPIIAQLYPSNNFGEVGEENEQISPPH